MVDNQVEEIKSKVDIVSLISEYLEVKKAGKNFKSNCPFHGEKTPSFMISPELQMFKCFGCGAGGDVFTFLERQEGMDFGEALRYLAEKVGVKLKYLKSGNDDIRDQILNVNKSTLNFYKYALLDHPIGKEILNYLIKERELKIETIKEFKLGFSPLKSEALVKYLTVKNKFKDDLLEKAGLLIKGKYGMFDRFSGRVTFPLLDHRGNIVGFSGRVLPWDKRDTGKYINSPETPLYQKSKILYGLNLTKNYIKESQSVIIVEGELDLISCYQAGIKNVVAIKGSALTEDQVRLLLRFCQKMTLCLDSDAAGDEATQRGAILAFNLGFDVFIARLIKFKDPDEAVRNDANGFKKSIEQAEGIWDFLINGIFEKHDVSTGEGKSKISIHVVKVLNLIDDSIVKAHYVELVARKLSVPVEAVINEVNKNQTVDNKKNDLYVQTETLKKDRRELLEERLFAILLDDNPKEFINLKIRKLFKNHFLNRIIELILIYLKKNKNFNLSKFSSNLPPELKEKFAEIVMNLQEKEEAGLILREIKMLDLRSKLKELSTKINQAEFKNDHSKLAELQQKFAKVAKRLSTLEED